MFHGVGPSCRSISSKSAIRYNSSSAHAREWLKPLSSIRSNPAAPTRLYPRRVPEDSFPDEGRSSASDPVKSFQAQSRSNTSREGDIFLKSLQREGRIFEPRRTDRSGRGFQSSKRQTPWYGDQGQDEPSQESKLPARWENDAVSRRGSEDSQLPQHRRSAPHTPYERNRMSFQPRRETGSDGWVSKDPSLHHRRDQPQRSLSFDKTQPRMLSGDEGSQRRRPPVNEAGGLEPLLHRPVHNHTPSLSEHRGLAPEIRPEDAIEYFESNVSDWALHVSNVQRIVSFGIPEVEARILLKRFIRETKAGKLSSDAFFYGLDRFGHKHDQNSIEVIYSTIFFSWASRQSKIPGINPELLDHIQNLVEATSQLFPQDRYPLARRLRRKVIIHVGPTNSGKTYHALRALAAADTGVYAGPLRLLAYEIFQRLNSGSIVPLGIEQDPAAPSGPNPAYARPCNLITGDERRTIAPDARHASCTVEMLRPDTVYDVAVIDEIQLIGEPVRGAKWTQAVLGLCAKELHLCGEETAVPVVQALLAHTGDEIEVRHYKRLTPLSVDDNVLNGDFSKIQAGDCVVAFSRSSIFAIKKAIEKDTNRRCAVVYGGLPPETRAEQAALFNDPNSGYDVLVGSDAIGMGLNLKIKRVIFSVTSKYDGKEVATLDVSSVKQIAGRAGRFGLHKDDLGGSTTTLFREDLPHLKYCLAQPYKPMAYGWLDLSEDQVYKLFTVLPASSTLQTAMVAGQYIGCIPSHLRLTNGNVVPHVFEFMQRQWADMPIIDKISLSFAPIPWRDPRAVEIITTILLQHRDEGAATLDAIIARYDIIKTIESVEKMVAQHNDATPSANTKSDAATPVVDSATGDHEAHGAESATVPVSQGKAKLGPGRAERQVMMSKLLATLESFHKVIVVYKWFTYRLPVTYAEGERAGELKERMEGALNGLLQMMSSHLEGRVGLRELAQGKTTPAGVAVESDKTETENPEILVES